jgi:hypothetical protein
MDRTSDFAIDRVNDFASLGMMIIVRQAIISIILWMEFKWFTVGGNSKKDLRSFGT